MGRDLQKRKRRSSRPAVKQHASSKPHRLLNPLGNDIIAKNWDKKQTTTQNYRRLGLVGRLKAPTGGAEPDKKKTAKKTKKPAADSFAIAPSSESIISEVRVERDASGKIIRILEGNSSSARSRRENPLNDPLNALDSGSDDDDDDDDDDGEAAEEWGGIDEDGEDDEEDEAKKIVRQLEAQANRPVEKRPRNQSQREREWLEALVAKHGDDTRAMVRDRVLNPMQQTEADLARRIRKLKKEAA